MSAGAERLARGGRLDRSRPLSFTFNGRRYQGCAGDTLASALLANGVHLVGRSFKYHRPRGILSAGPEEPNALVQLGTGSRAEANARATQIALHDGLVATSVNCWPGVRWDLGAVANRLGRLLPAGFYYKTFMWPRSMWRAYEYVIRRAAGLGRAPDAPDPDRYDKRHDHCDVLTAGGGPAGLMAALAAGRAGARVILADEQGELGGALLGNGETVDGKPASEWVAGAVTRLEAMAEVRLLSGATVFGYYDHNYLAIAERLADGPGEAPVPRPRQRLWKLRAKQVVLATGAIERPLVFADNDRPGIMLASAARAYVNRYAARPGRRAVVFTNNDSAYRAALDLARAGIEVAAIVDLRPEPSHPAADAARASGIEVLGGMAIVAVHGVRRVKAVEIMALTEAGDAVHGEARTIACDLVAMSGGWSPSVHLFSQSGGKLRFDEGKGCFVPGRSKQAERSAGACAGAFPLTECLAQGWAAGAQAAVDAGRRRAGRAPRLPRALDEKEAPPRGLWLVPSVAPVGRRGWHFVEFQTDVTAADIALAVREGYQQVEHVKRFTTLGMGTDQGKTGNLNALAVLSRTLNRDIAALGTTTFRPPYSPVSFGVMAGRDVGALYAPVRGTPMHHWHQAQGARFEDVGLWRRARYYPKPGEDLDQAVNRECLAVRNGVGLLDASTLGKIDIQGPDAARLLNRVYTNVWDDLEIGRCRYGVMCGEDGMVLDDGVTSRLGRQRYLMTTTSGNAPHILAWLEEWLQCEWSDLDVHCTSLTEHWAVATLAGPNARRLLSGLAAEIDLDGRAFPHMSWRQGAVAGIPARLFRVSFTGELSYEINVPASYGQALWLALMTAGAAYGIAPFGTEALMLLRAEKGHFVVGEETDGTVTPVDLGLDWIISKKKRDFIGKRSLSRPDCMRADRKQLVGLMSEEPQEVLPVGGQIVAELKRRPPMAMIGHVTSSYYSPTLGRSIALALVKGGRRRHGEQVHVPLDNKTLRATITEPRFYDVEGTRLGG